MKLPKPITPGIVRCGQRGSCRYEAIVVREDIAFADFAHVGGWEFDHARFCRGHASAAQRRKYNQPDRLIPIADAPGYIAEYHRRKTEREAEEKRKHEAAEAERQRRNEEAAEHDWANLDNPFSIDLVEEDKGFLSTRIEQEVKVTEIDHTGWNSEWTIDFLQTEPGPRYIRIGRSGTLTPLGARALAEGLIKAAEIAEATNARLRAEREESK